VSVRVLLVEDEGIIRLMTTEMLEEEGFEVVEARDGDEAVRLLAQGEPFNVLFTDVQMPGILDGIGVAMHIRKLYPTIPVLVVSGYAAQLTARLGALNPPAVFLDKPYDMDDVVSSLTRLTAKG
jgi:CheY-like chemotaxis protein